MATSDDDLHDAIANSLAAQATVGGFIVEHSDGSKRTRMAGPDEMARAMATLRRRRNSAIRLIKPLGDT